MWRRMSVSSVFLLFNNSNGYCLGLVWKEEKKYAEEVCAGLLPLSKKERTFLGFVIRWGCELRGCSH